ncbi:MAG: hypothetical protein ISR65_18640 [Bacteriovoracaceae bacterium]|nr:hypothetical protein [Bacteriovoracaceae bacterium]
MKNFFKIIVPLLLLNSVAFSSDKVEIYEGADVLKALLVERVEFFNPYCLVAHMRRRGGGHDIKLAVGHRIHRMEIQAPNAADKGRKLYNVRLEYTHPEGFKTDPMTFYCTAKE